MADFHGTQEVVTDLREDGVLIMRINRPETVSYTHLDVYKRQGRQHRY